MPNQRERDVEFGEVLSFRLGHEEARRLRELARRDDRPLSNFTRQLVLAGIRQVDQMVEAGT